MSNPRPLDFECRACAAPPGYDCFTVSTCGAFLRRSYHQERMGQAIGYPVPLPRNWQQLRVRAARWVQLVNQGEE